MMIITKKAIGRRTMLRGVGTPPSRLCPWDRMFPAKVATAPIS